MIYNITKFRHYLLGRKFTFLVDHSTLLYLVTKQSLTDRLARWTLLLQEFKIDIHHGPGVQHVLADYLSRLESGKLAEGVLDDLPDADIFGITTTPPNLDPMDKWIDEMMQFLNTGLPLEHLTLDATKRLAVRR